MTKKRVIRICKAAARNLQPFFLLPLLLLMLLMLLPATLPDSTPAKPAEDPGREGDLWVSAYLASWQHNAGTPYSNWGAMTASDIDWDAFTHLIYFALNIGSDGRPGMSLDPQKRNNLNTDRIRSIVSAAHRNDTKILVSVGGAGNYNGFSSAIGRGNRARFIDTLAGMIRNHGFDGVDLDMEPIRRSDYNNYYQFVSQLHEEFSRLRTRNGEKPMITIAAVKGESVSRLYARVQQYVDQINIMTYDMAMPWSGWQAWHHSALFSDGVRFDRGGGQMSSVQQKVEEAVGAGVERRKLGIGIDFYGYIWHGVNLLEKWDSWPQEDMSILEKSGGVPYSELYQRFNLDEYSWDETAQTSYLDIRRPRKFVSFDNERSVRRKMQYAVEERIGGVILWELGGGFLTDRSTGPRDPLLQAVKDELNRLP